MSTNNQHLEVIAKLLHTALGYGSREDRIQRLENSSDLDVRMYVTQLRYAGYLTPDGIKLPSRPAIDKLNRLR